MPVVSFKIPKLLMLLLCMVGSLLGCDTSKTISSHTNTIRIGIDVYPGWGHAFIAKEKNLFKKNNVKNVELVFKKSYLDVLNEYEKGLIDGAFLVYADVIYLNAQGLSSKIPYISDHSNGADVFIANKDILSFDQLRDKTIGIEGFNSFSHLFVLSILEKNGLNENDVMFKSINAQDIVNEIEANNIAAGHTYGPGKEHSKMLSYNTLATSEDMKGIITDVLSIRSDVIEKNNEQVEGIVKSLYEAKTFQMNNPAEAISIISEHTNTLSSTIIDGINSVEYLNLADSHTSMISNPPGDMYLYGEKIANFFLERKQIPIKPDLNEILHPIYVENILNQKTNSLL